MSESTTWTNRSRRSGRSRVPEAMAIALQCLKNGQFEEASGVCRKILEVAPEHPDAMHYAGVMAHEDGRSDEALALIERSLELAPDQPDWYSNLGIVRAGARRSRGRHRGVPAGDRAQAGARQRAWQPRRAAEGAGQSRRGRGRVSDAIELNPKHADAYHNLAVLLSATDRAPEAVTCYCRALTLKPHYPEARRALALAYCLLGQRDRAIAGVRGVDEGRADDRWWPGTRWRRARGRDVPPRASDEYVQRIFDSFASSFEAKLARLDYRAPSLVAEALAASGIAADRSLDVLDAGCGTGLCGPLRCAYARRLVGVDLSGGMLNHAAEKTGLRRSRAGGADRVSAAACASAFDVILTADTLVYFGALEEVVAAAALALRPGGVFIFTVEEATEPDGADSYSLQPHGRYSTAPLYVERLLVEAGLHADIGRAEFRLESGVPVAGLVVRGAKPVNAVARSRNVPPASRRWRAPWLG